MKLTALPPIALAVLAACAHGGAEAPIANKTQGPHGPTSEIRAIDWQNRTYVLDELGPVVVKNGEGELRRPAEEDAIGGSYTVARPVFGDVDGDGIEDVIVSSVLSTGGTGRFSDVRIYTMKDGRVVELAAIPGGDRGDGGVRRVAIEGHAVVVERNVLAEGDGACCASQARRERWVWRDGEITEDESARRAIEPRN
jgi:hypothetical protein